MGYIGIDRKIEHHWIYQDAEYFKVWFEILLRTRFSTEPEKKLLEGKFITVEYAQFIFGRVSWSEKLKISERRIRTLFDKLIKDNMIQVVSKYPKFTIYHVVNFAKYRPNFDQQSDQQTDQQQDQMALGVSDISDQQNDSTTTSNRPAADQQPTTQEKGSNKVNKDNKDLIKDIIPFSDIIDYLNLKAETKYRASSQATQRLITARWNQNFRIEDFMTVIDKKTAEWMGTDMQQYLCPDTLFGTKFEKYLNQKIVLRGGQTHAPGDSRRNQSQGVSGKGTFTPSISDEELDELHFNANLRVPDLQRLGNH